MDCKLYRQALQEGSMWKDCKLNRHDQYDQKEGHWFHFSMVPISQSVVCGTMEDQRRREFHALSSFMNVGVSRRRDLWLYMGL